MWCNEDNEEDEKQFLKTNTENVYVFEFYILDVKLFKSKLAKDLEMLQQPSIETVPIKSIDDNRSMATIGADLTLNLKARYTSIIEDQERLILDENTSLKMNLNVYDYFDMVIDEEYFQESLQNNIKKLREQRLNDNELDITDKPLEPLRQNLLSKSLKAIYETMNDYEIRPTSVNRCMFTSTTEQFVNKILYDNINIDVFLKDIETSEEYVYGCAKIQLSQPFIDIIMVGTTATLKPLSYCDEYETVITNSLDEFVGFSKLFVRLSCYGKKFWPDLNRFDISLFDEIEEWNEKEK